MGFFKKRKKYNLHIENKTKNIYRSYNKMKKNP